MIAFLEYYEDPRKLTKVDATTQLPFCCLRVVRSILASYNFHKRFLQERISMTRKPGTSLLPLMFLALSSNTVGTFCLAQTPPATTQRPRKVFPAEQEPADVLRIDTDLVSVDVTATNLEGLPVRNLRQDDFKVYSDGAEQQVSFFNVERRDGEPRPLAIVFALDISGSMTAEEMERLRGALRSFSGQLSNHPVAYAVMVFGMHVKTLQRFTSEPDKLDRTFDRLAR